MSSTSENAVQPSFVSRLCRSLSRKFSQMLDSSVPHPILRWIFCIILYGLYGVRVYFIQGFYIISYGLGIYCLNLLIGFLSPIDETELQGPTIPEKDSDEFRPFQRRLPEFQFWKSATRAIILATIGTFFQFLDIPVFWPILLLYFIILFVLTMKRQIRHMIKFNYIPLSWGKKTYLAKNEESVTKKKEPLPRIRRPPVRSLPQTTIKRVNQD